MWVKTIVDRVHITLGQVTLVCVETIVDRVHITLGHNLNQSLLISTERPTVLVQVSPSVFVETIVDRAHISPGHNLNQSLLISTERPTVSVQVNRLQVLNISKKLHKTIHPQKEDEREMAFIIDYIHVKELD